MTNYCILPRAILRITGDNAAKFLQALITNDIYSNTTIYAMMLSATGRYALDFFITNVSNGYILETDITTLSALILRLRLYRMRSKVEIEDITDKYQVIYSREKIDIDSLCTYQDPRFNKMGFRAVTLKEYSKNSISTDLYTEDKYLYAIPDGNTDLIPDKSMPQEYGMDHLNAISYSKGCYLGQEVICRTKTQGVIRKQIFKITSDVSLQSIEHGTPILADKDKIGILCSSHNNCGISLIRTEDYVTKKQMHLTIAGIPITLHVPEWVNNI